MDRKTDIEIYRHDLEVIRDTAEQVIKDFGITGHEIKFSGSPLTAYQELSDQVSGIIEKMVKDDLQSLMNLLYRIDVDESGLNEVMSLNNEDGIISKLTQLVLERELVKCIWRKLHRNTEK